MKCGREPGGVRVPELGVCRASTDTSADGLNGGKNGGRICWAVAGSYSNLDIPDSTECLDAVEKFSCITCAFFGLVEKEESPAKFHILKPGRILFY